MQAASHLAGLNERQRAAAAFGIAPGAIPPPLLVIAGAGSGKTSTLAHRWRICWSTAPIRGASC